MKVLESSNNVPEQKPIVGVKICRRFQTVSLATVSSDCPSWWFVGRTNHCRLVRLLLGYLFYRATAFHVRLKNPFFGDFYWNKTTTVLSNQQSCFWVTWISRISSSFLEFVVFLHWAFLAVWRGKVGDPIMRFQVPTPEFWGVRFCQLVVWL